MKKEPVVFVVSDSMGETAQLVARAVLSQFPDGTVQLQRFNHIETPMAAEKVVIAAGSQPTLIIFTVIVPEVRAVILEHAARSDIPTVDIMGPALSGVEKISGHKALLEPGLIHRLDEKYFRRVDAIEFAVQHDDGKDPRGYRKADVVLLGVSRTSKTPVSMYLANRGVKVANLPLIPGIVPPPELNRVPAKKIVGLTINPAKLGQIRKERERTMGVRGESDYSDLRRIREELGFANELYRELGCDVIDVTDRAVEETAAVVMELIRALRSSTG
jgi:regulator of PEP synthase PpsR (kinase-PPPase family)